MSDLNLNISYEVDDDVLIPLNAEMFGDHVGDDAEHKLICLYDAEDDVFTLNMHLGFRSIQFSLTDFEDNEVDTFKISLRDMEDQPELYIGMIDIMRSTPNMTEGKKVELDTHRKSAHNAMASKIDEVLANHHIVQEGFKQPSEFSRDVVSAWFEQIAQCEAEYGREPRSGLSFKSFKFQL